MAQYWKYTANKYQYWTLSDGRKVREGQNNDHHYTLDVELYVNGFNDAINVGWQTIDPYEDTIISGGTVRVGIKNEYSECHVVIEGEKTTLGVYERIQTIN